MLYLERRALLKKAEEDRVAKENEKMSRDRKSNVKEQKPTKKKKK